MTGENRDLWRGFARNQAVLAGACFAASWFMPTWWILPLAWVVGVVLAAVACWVYTRVANRLAFGRRPRYAVGGSISPRPPSDDQMINFAALGACSWYSPEPPASSIVLEVCRVYWGSHGCMLPRRHEGDCICECALDPDDDPDVRNVGAPPYYGDGQTWFYGEDAAERGLPMITNEGDQR